MQSPRFLWGAATAGYKVEGNNVNSPDFAKLGVAADHWKRWKEDFVLMKDLGLTAYRLSLDWSRIEPSPGAFNQAAMHHYREMLLELQRLNIQVLVVLQDGSCPTWFTDSGGWRTAENVAAFSGYAKYVAHQVGDLVWGWIIAAEPFMAGAAGWLQQVEIKLRAGQVRTAVAKVIRAAGPVAQIEGYDWLSLQVSDVATDDLLAALKRYRKQRKPIYILDSREFTDDKEQGDFIQGRLRVIEEAQALGINIRGYFYDCLLDGVELDKNLVAKKGLLAVNFLTQERSVQPFAYVYKAIIQQATHSS